MNTYNNLELSLSSGSNGDQISQPQPMTIFYNGKISVCDVTELQARSIILFASRKLEEEITRCGKGGPTLQSSHQLCSPTGLSMKRSLRQFLEKRRLRIQATSPYYR